MFFLLIECSKVQKLRTFPYKTFIKSLEIVDVIRQLPETKQERQPESGSIAISSVTINSLSSLVLSSKLNQSATQIVVRVDESVRQTMSILACSVRLKLPRKKLPQDRAGLSTVVCSRSRLPLVYSELVCVVFSNLYKPSYFEIFSPIETAATKANPKPSLTNCSEVFLCNNSMISCALFKLCSQFLISAEALRRRASNRRKFIGLLH